jgi:peptide deformylase
MSNILSLVHYPDDPLTKVSTPVTVFGDELARLADDMLATMYAHDGLGLAAPQVGISKRLFVLCEPEGEEMCLVNPSISEPEGAGDREEGCLSIPQIYANVTRPTRIRVQAKDVFGKELDFVANDLLARIIQHELDHLDGIVFLDRVDILTREDKLREWEEVRQKLRASIVGKP